MSVVAEWLETNWAIAVTAFATAATAFLVWLDRRDRKRRELPFVECNITAAPGAPAGWIRIALIIRNFNPYVIHVVELRIKQPNSSAIFSEFEAFTAASVKNVTRQFIGTDAKPQLVAKINRGIAPSGSFSTGPISAGAADRIFQNFYYSAGPGRSGLIKVKMILICEVRSREVQTKEIAITRTISFG